MKLKTLPYLLTPALALGAIQTQAADIEWNGFMSVAFGKTMDTGTTYLVDPVTGGTYDDQLRFNPESMMALQARSNISDNLRATVQVLAKGGNDYAPDVEWAYLSYDLRDNLTINAGRFRFPVFYYSDSLDVGYSYHWIRPPVDIYSVFFSRVDGINAYYTTFAGPVELEAQAWYGGIEIEDQALSSTTDQDITNNQGLVGMASWEWFKVRAVYHTTDFASTATNLIENEEDPLNLFWTQFGTEVGGTTNFEIDFVAAALMFDYDNLFVRGEYTETGTKLPGISDSKANARYASAGYRIGDYTPAITYIRRYDPGFFAPKTTTRTWSAGLSWNFQPGAVFKVEYLSRTQDSVGVETDTSLLAFAVDTVF